MSREKKKNAIKHFYPFHKLIYKIPVYFHFNMFLYNEIVENAVPVPNAHHHFFENTGALNNTFRLRPDKETPIPFYKGN